MSNRQGRRPRRRTRAQWLSLVERQADSGLSAKAFCEREALGYKSFIRWRAEYNASAVSARDDFIELTPPGRLSSSQLSPPLPLPVQATDDGCVMELCVGESVRVRIFAGR